MTITAAVTFSAPTDLLNALQTLTRSDPVSLDSAFVTTWPPATDHAPISVPIEATLLNPRRSDPGAGSGQPSPADQDRRTATLVTGPWFGELGVLLARWLPYVRWLRQQHPRAWLIAGGYPDEACLYEGVADEFWGINPALRRVFRDAETANNYGTLPSLHDEYGVHEHNRRKDFRDTRPFHDAVATAWLSRLAGSIGESAPDPGATALDGVEPLAWPVQIACGLGEGRTHARLLTRDPGRLDPGHQKQAAKRRAHTEMVRRFVDDRQHVDSRARPLVMLLPRLRGHQGAERSWEPGLYAKAAQALVDALEVNVALLGSPVYEPDPLPVARPGRVLDLSREGLYIQLAYWQIAAAATGPLSGGLVPAYFTDTPPVFWHKGLDRPTGRGGLDWQSTAEPDYAVLGITATWARVDSENDLPTVVNAVKAVL